MLLFFLTLINSQKSEEKPKTNIKLGKPYYAVKMGNNIIRVKPSGKDEYVIEDPNFEEIDIIPEGIEEVKEKTIEKEQTEKNIEKIEIPTEKENEKIEIKEKPIKLDSLPKDERPSIRKIVPMAPKIELPVIHQ